MDLDEANNLNRDIMRLVKSMPRLELGTRITLRKDKTQDIRSLDLSLSPSLPLSLSLSLSLSLIHRAVWRERV